MESGLVLEQGLVALGLMAIAVGLSAWQQLGLSWGLTLAAARAAVQLFVVGYLLEVVFVLNQPWAVGLVLLVLLSVAAVEVRNRIGKEVPWVLPIVWGSLLVGSLLTLLYALWWVVPSPTGSAPQSLIPLAGLVLGNAMNGAALAGERLTRAMTNHRLEIETHLCLGATPAQAIAPYRREAVRTAMIPTINAMMVAGVVTLPSVLAGELLGGIPPLLASLYQILILFMFALATLITTLLVTQGLYRQYFNRAQQLVLP